MKKILKKPLVGLMALTMMFSVTAMTASADEVKLDVGKTVTVGEGVNAPTETYNFRLTPVTVPNGTKEQDGKINVYTGVLPDGVDGSSTISLDKDTLTGTVTYDFTGYTFANPGVYRYELTETAGSTHGMTYDGSKFIIDVYADRVNDNGNYVVTPKAVVSYTTDAEGNRTEKAQTTGFVNIFAAQNLEVSKTVTGNQADYKKQFNFNISLYSDAVEGQDNCVLPVGTTVKGIITRQDGSTEEVVVTAVANDSEDASATFTLAHGEKLIITGIPEGISYAVNEVKSTDDGSNDYDTTVQGQNANTEATESDAYTATMDGDGDTVGFVNDRTSSVPTGVILGVMPFAGALVIGVGAVLLKKKKKEDEE